MQHTLDRISLSVNPPPLPPGPAAAPSHQFSKSLEQDCVPASGLLPLSPCAGTLCAPGVGWAVLVTQVLVLRWYLLGEAFFRYPLG